MGRRTWCGSERRENSYRASHVESARMRAPVLIHPTQPINRLARTILAHPAIADHTHSTDNVTIT